MATKKNYQADSDEAWVRSLVQMWREAEREYQNVRIDLTIAPASLQSRMAVGFSASLMVPGQATTNIESVAQMYPTANRQSFVPFLFGQLSKLTMMLDERFLKVAASDAELPF